MDATFVAPGAPAQDRTRTSASYYNNFDAIRIIAAFLVLYSHQFALTGQPEPSFFGLHSWGGLAVIVFFVVSGYLVTSSWYNDPNVLRFAARRVLRLWPALTVIVVLTAYGLGAWVTTLPLMEYWKHRATLDYLHILKMQIYYVLPGVFTNNPYPSGVNGSLWTIPLEVRCYLVLGLAGLLQLLRWRTVWLALIAAYLVWFLAKSSADITGHVHYGRELSAFFLSGSALFLLQQHWERRPLTWLLCASAIGLLLWWSGWRYTATLTALPLTILYAGTRSTPIIRRFGRWGDPSYGAYLLAFPVQQTLIHFLYPQFGFMAMLGLSTVVTFALAYASWHAIEKPALRLKPRRRHAPPGGGSAAHRAWARWRARVRTRDKTHAAGQVALLLTLFLGLCTTAAQAAYQYRAGATALELLLGCLPVIGASVLLCAACGWATRLRRAWLGLGARMLLVVVAFVGAAMTLIAAIGDWQTGSIPRLQQLEGLTWDIVGPSVTALAREHLAPTATAFGAALAVLVALAFFLRKLPASRRPRPAPAVFFGAILLAAGLAAQSASMAAHPPFIATWLLHRDIDPTTALTAPAQRAENQFFRQYHEQLGQVQGPSPFPAIQAALHGTNIVWVVLESIRAKDVPLYGGAARMPNFMRAREHMLLLDHLYVQDPRSTKAYTQMDLGKFSLLSWSTYSNDLPWMWPEDGLANRLRKLGYFTVSLVNADAHYDNNQLFQQRHGYDRTFYRQAINPDSSGADDLKLLARAREQFARIKQPFYMMLWPVQTHHPYGSEYWVQEHKANIVPPGDRDALGAADHARYLRALGQADDWFGQLLQTLSAEGLADNTTIVVTGDHGQAFGEHERANVFHGNGVYEESVHVPGFIYSPRIQGLHHDTRNLRLLDIPATILHTAASEDYLFNDGRSLFKNYANDIPIYLYSSWGGAVGIIAQGKKLWRRTHAPADLFGASMADIQRDPSKERQRISAESAAPLLELLNPWERAMQTRTARLLRPKDARQPPIDDVVRVYCDDGTGFREGNKGLASVAGLSGQISMALNQRCRALRFAPILDTPIPEGSELQVRIDALTITGKNGPLSINDLVLAFAHDMTVVDESDFFITGRQPFIDFTFKDAYEDIADLSASVSYLWRSRPESVR